jgi:hypothetical protein
MNILVHLKSGCAIEGAQAGNYSGESRCAIGRNRKIN